MSRFYHTRAGWLVIFSAPWIALAAPLPSTQTTELEPIEVPSNRDAVREGGIQPDSVPIDRKIQGTMASQLASSPAIFFRKWGTDDGAQVLSLRGQDPVQTRLTLNGIPLGDGAQSGTDLRWLRTQWLDHSTLLPNGDPWEAWHETLGGAVDLATPFGEEDGAGEVAQYNVGAAVGSFGAQGLNGQVGIPTSTAAVRKFGVGIDARQASDDFLYRDSLGTAWNLDDDVMSRRNGNAWGRVTFFPWAAGQVGEVGLRVFGLGGWENRELLLPGATVLGTTVLHWKEELHLLAAEASMSRVGLKFRSYGRHRQNNLKNAGAGRGAAGIASIPAQSQEVAGGASVHWSSSVGSLRGHLASTVEVETLKNRWELGRSSSVEGNRRSIRGVAGLERSGLLSWLVSLPVEANAYSPTGSIVGYSGQPSKTIWLFSPRVSVSGLVFDALRWQVAIVHLERSPGLYDLYGDSHGLVPSNLLGPERAWKVEGSLEQGWRLQNSRIAIRSTSALSLNSDLIARVSVGPTSSMAQNIGRARIFSQDLSASFSHPIGFRGVAAGEWLHTMNDSSIPYYHGKELPFRPKLRWVLDASQHFNRLSFGYLWQWQSKFFTDQYNATTVEAFQEHSLRARYHDETFGTWTVELSNLFDSTSVGAQVLGQAFTLPPSGMAGYPYPGRRVYLTWNYSWR